MWINTDGTPFIGDNTCDDVLFDPSPMDDAAGVVRLCNFEKGKKSSYRRIARLSRH